MGVKLLILVFCAVLQQHSTAARSQLPKGTKSDYDYDLSQQQQETEDDGIAQFQRNLNQRPVEMVHRPRAFTITDACLEPKKVGRCRQSLPRWFFNKGIGQCGQFLYGGCEGNGNNFEDLAACENRCSGHLKRPNAVQDISLVSEETCTLPPVDRDPSKSYSKCAAYLSRWYFNSTTETCTNFIYNGCGATKNFFPSWRTCNQKCGNYQKPTVPPKAEIPVLEKISLKKSALCELEVSPGPCYGTTHRFYYNGQNSRCQTFVYGGCGGNGNNFGTAEDCVRACGGDSPNFSTGCANVTCPWNLYTHYTSKDCKPIYDGQSCCPTRFQCPSEPVKEAAVGPVCKYRGKTYSIGDQMTEASSNSACRAACSCQGFGGQARINCASVECPENLGATPPGKENCTKLYTRGTCCATNFSCHQEAVQAPEPFKCDYEGKSYVEGEKIFPSRAKCRTCLCQKGFNGSLSDEFCEDIDCGIEIYYSDQLSRGCSPVYFREVNGEERCCPIGWECPDDQAPAPPRLTPSSTILSPIPALAQRPAIQVPNERRVTIEACSLPRVTGPCRASRSRYFYNTLTKSCDKFVYGGCEGNENNFVLLKDCENICKANAEEIDRKEPTGRAGTVRDLPSTTYELTEVDPCTQPPKTGACRAFFPRFYFSATENACKPFIYGGCRGNKNNFHTLEACAAVCQNLIEVRARAAVTEHESEEEKPGDSTRVNFEEEQAQVPDTTHIRVIDITNRTVELDTEDPCVLQPETGRCKAHYRRYYYDSATGYCRHFIYGGCGGNPNNFERLKECDVRCSPNKGKGLPGPGIQPRWRSVGIPTATPTQEPAKPAFGGYTERCLIPMNAGPCEASIPAFYYNIETGRCQNFTYGGCFGNANRFSSLRECESACKELPEAEPTTDPRVSSRAGPGTYIRRTTDFPVIPNNPDVIQLTPGGRRERPTVEDQVQDDKAFCSQPPVQGNCRAHNLRYHFSTELQQCRPFVYSGCRGNRNNFLTESDCLTACGPEPTIEKITQDGILSCSFGNQTIPIGGKLGGPAQEEPCGEPVCTCVTPPALTCIQAQCPPPPCPTPSCGPNCKPAIRPDNGCPTCDCEENQEQFQVEMVNIPPAVKVESVKGWRSS